jgi:hypothetical protein
LETTLQYQYDSFVLWPGKNDVCILCPLPVLGELSTYRAGLTWRDTYVSLSFSLWSDPVCLGFFLGHIAQGRIRAYVCPSFPSLFDEDVFIAAQCIGVSQLSYNYDIDLKGSQCLFNLQSSVEGESGAPSRCFRCRELNTELHKFWDCSPTLCYQLSLWVSLFTCNIILHMFNITKLTSTYIPL